MSENGLELLRSRGVGRLALLSLVCRFGVRHNTAQRRKMVDHKWQCAQRIKSLFMGLFTYYALRTGEPRQLLTFLFARLLGGNCHVVADVLNSVDASGSSRRGYSMESIEYPPYRCSRIHTMDVTTRMRRNPKLCLLCYRLAPLFGMVQISKKKKKAANPVPLV